jgi:hypothetical protein
MRKLYLLPFLFFLLISIGCEKDAPMPFWYTITNESGFDVTLKSKKGDPDIVVKAGEKKEVSVTSKMEFDIVPSTPTTKIFEHILPAPSHITIFSYDYMLEYVVNGTAETADITIYNEKQKKETYQNVTLPAKFQYRSYCKCPAYVSATIVSGSGYVAATILKKGKYVAMASSSTSKPATVFVDDWE